MFNPVAWSFENDQKKIKDDVTTFDPVKFAFSSSGDPSSAVDSTAPKPTPSPSLSPTPTPAPKQQGLDLGNVVNNITNTIKSALIKAIPQLASKPTTQNVAPDVNVDNNQPTQLVDNMKIGDTQLSFTAPTKNALKPQAPMNPVVKGLDDLRTYLIKEFPQTAVKIDELMTRKADLDTTGKIYKKDKGNVVGPEATKHVLEDVYNVVVPTIAEGIRRVYEDKQPSKTIPEAVGKKISAVTGAVNVMFTPISAFFAAIENYPVVGKMAGAVSLPFQAVGEGATKFSDTLVDNVFVNSPEIKKAIKQPVGEAFALAAQIALGKAMHITEEKAVSTIKNVGTEAFTKLTKNISEQSGSPVVYNISPAEVRKIATVGSTSVEAGILKDMGMSGDQWANAAKKGISVQVTPDQIINIVDKPYFAKIKALLKIEPTNITKAVPGDVVNRGSFAGYLPEGEHTPQAVVNAVIKNNAQSTPEGQAMIKTALEAQNQGKNIMVGKPSATTLTLDELIKIKTPNLEQIKLINKLRGEQMTNSGGTSAENIAEVKMGWKPGQKDIFDKAMSSGDKATVEKMLPEVPKYFKEEFSKEINQIVTGNKPGVAQPFDVSPYEGKSQAQVNALVKTNFEKQFPTQKGFVDNFDWKVKEVPIDQVNLHVAADGAKVKQYITDLDKGTKFPPILETNTGGIREALDGAHRGEMMKAKGFKTITVLEGTPKMEIADKPVIKVENKTLYRGTRVDSKPVVTTADQSWPTVLVVKSNQAELIQDLAKKGIEAASKLLEKSPNPAKVDFIEADQIIKDELGDTYDAIQYDNDTPLLRAQGTTYFDLSTGQSFAEKPETARVYAMNNRASKYEPLSPTPFDPQKATVEQQKELLKNLVVGKGEYKPGELYTQKVQGVDRPVIITKVNPNGSVEGFYAGSMSLTEKSFGINQSSLQSAKWNSPTKELRTPEQADTLLYEAKKYKSAEEFVDVMAKEYNASSGKTRDITKQFYTSQDKEYVKNFGEMVDNYYVGATKPLDLTPQKTKEVSYRALKKVFSEKGIDITGIVPKEMQTGVEDPVWFWLMKYKDITTRAKSAGYDLIKLTEKIDGQTKETDSSIVLNPNIVKTKSQLTDIWNKENRGVENEKPTDMNDQDKERVAEGSKVSAQGTYQRGDITKITKQMDEILGIDSGMKNFKEKQTLWQQNYSFMDQVADSGDLQAQADILRFNQLNAELERLRGLKNQRTPTGLADAGGYSDVASSQKQVENLKAIQFPELVRIVRELMGEDPTLKSFSRALGKFYANPLDPSMKLNPSIFSDPVLAAKVIAHELGHLVDFLPDNTSKRGNILGRIATLNKYMGRFISEEPGGQGTITPEDRDRLRKEAAEIAKKPVSIETEIVVGEQKATPEQIVGIWNDLTMGEKYPELLDYIQSLSQDQKIEIVKHAMKGLIPQWVDFKTFSKERVITQVIQDAPEDIKKIYERLVKEEVEKRKLLSNEQIRAELKALSMLWKPFDPTLSANYTKYRYSSVELYADALSVLFNDPALFKEKAPIFSKAFFNYLDNKPEVKQVYADMQILLEKGEDAVNDARLATIYEGFEAGAKKRTEIENKETPKKSWMEKFMFNHITKFDPIYRILKKKSGNDANSNAQLVREALEIMQFRRQDQHAFAYTMSEDIIKALEAIGLDERDLGVVLKLEREAIGDRMMLANPGGLIGEIPLDVLKRFYATRKMSEAQIKVFEQIKNRFHDLVFAETERAAKNGNYDPVVFEEKIRPNKYTYATFSVVDYIDKNFISAGIKKQGGTLKDIENPVVSTILKTMSLIDWNNMQEAKLVATQALLEDAVEDISDAKPIKDSGGKIIKFKKEENREVIELMRAGKRIGYNVDPYIKRMFDDESMTPNELHALVAVTRSFNRVFKPLVTTYKPGWAFWSNIVRDQARTYINLGAALNKFAGGKKGLSIAELLVSYVRSIPEGAKFAAGKRDELITEMLANKAMSTPWISYDPYANNDGDIGFILRKYKVLGEDKPTHIVRKVFDKTFGKLLSVVQYMGAVGEATSKISGYKIAKKRIDDGRKLGFIVRNYVGTPNYMEGGAYKQMDNDIFVFSNIMAQATRISAELAVDPQTRSGYWWRTFKIGFLPKLLMVAAIAGLFGEKVKDAYEKMTEYDKTNYITIPVGFDENKKAVYLRVPMDETERFFGAMVWKLGSAAVQGKTTKPEQVLALGAGYLPSLTPLFDIVGSWIGYAQGRNPYDSYRGRLAIDDTSWRAGGMTRLGKMVQYTLNEAGVGNFKTYDTGGQSTLETTVQGIPIINRMFQVSDYGLAEKYTSGADQEGAQKSLDRREVVDKYVKQSKGKTNAAEILTIKNNMVKDYFNGPPKSKEQITEAKALMKKFDIQRQKGSSQYLDKLIYSSLNSEKVDYLLQFKKDMGDAEFVQLQKDALKYKIIGTDVILQMRRRLSQGE